MIEIISESQNHIHQACEVGPPWLGWWSRLTLRQRLVVWNYVAVFLLFVLTDQLAPESELVVDPIEAVLAARER